MLAVLPTQDLTSRVRKVFTTYAQPLGQVMQLLRGGAAAREPLSRRGVGDKVHQLADMLVATLRDQPWRTQVHSLLKICQAPQSKICFI